jgi:hypothetical protein
MISQEPSNVLAKLRTTFLLAPMWPEGFCGTLVLWRCEP